ncbi:glycoside hydrolase family 15 [Georgenia faecalis]|uniref:glycoside hydrolase family 15 n=1 Tax=Georgenia faecalis TaxID=2483799 RepID=UPI000FDAB7F2|nr:glycoside hydrolase family 15 [Georgenia faecalis]
MDGWERRTAWTTIVVLYLSTVTWSAHLRVTEPRDAQIDLYLDGVHVRPDGTVGHLPAGSAAQYQPDSRVLAEDDDPRALAIAAEQRAWLAEGTVPGAGTAYEDLVTGALLDIRTLTGATFTAGAEPGLPGAAVAGWTGRWRYVWPRDSAFVAVALARTGHGEDALAVLGFLEEVQEEDGLFEARYLPDASGPPDERGTQLDGLGWVLWASGAVLDALDGDARATALAELRPLLDRTADRVLALTARPPHLPPASPDYWEVAEDQVTLGTAAPMLAGLEAAARLYADAGESHRAASLSARAAQVRTAVEEAFGPRGYTRYSESTLGNTLRGRDGRDAATAMLLPPFVTEPLAGAEAAWLASAGEMARPAGGLAPGAGWKPDGISWTPQTSLYALTAASTGHVEEATDWLDWLAEHRTSSGAIPEKVLADGSPAAVAPLTWSSANVVLAVAALEEAGALP